MITKKQVHEEMLDASVAEVISKLVSNPKFSDLIRNKINMEVDTSALDQEIENYKIQLRKLYHNKDTILSDMDSLDYEDKHYQRRKTDLENHLYKTYDKIDDAEELLVSAKAKKRSLLADKITGDGFLSDKQLEYVANKMGWEENVQTNSVRIVIMHHHYMPTCLVEQVDVKKPSSVVYDAERLVQWLAKYDIKLLLHGHKHQSFVSKIGHFDNSIYEIDEDRMKNIYVGRVIRLF